jgi:hypothetical protein
VRTDGELINRHEGVRVSLVLVWKFDANGTLANIEAMPRKRG